MKKKSLQGSNIQLSHGSGGIQSQILITELFYKHLKGSIVGMGEDAGIEIGRASCRERV